MKISVAWLQKYFDEPLPSIEELVDALTFHSSEVEGVEEKATDTMLDVKVLPDRAPYALSHRGIASELAAALDRPLSIDPLREPLPAFELTDRITVQLENPEKSLRYMAALVTGVKVGPSPQWLADALSAVGQRSINNVVDATNYVMLNIGQPLHAFDAGKIGTNAEGAYAIGVRAAREGEKITTLTGEEFTLPKETLVITDGTNDAAIGIAGIKGGKRAEVTSGTADILIEAANFDGTSVRRAAQALKLWTDASLRFQNKISPELAAYGMRDVLALITELAGGAIAAVADEYPNPEAPQSPVSMTREQLNSLLGTDISMDEIENVCARLSIACVPQGETVTAQPPFERRDLTQWQDIAEEVGRILGYDRVTPESLPAMKVAPDHASWRGGEAIKDILTKRGFTEISTPSFATEGEVRLANPLQQERPFLRASLKANMQDALSRAAQQAPRVLGPEPALKLFELGTVFRKDDEHLSLCIGYRQLSGKSSAVVLTDVIDALTSAYPSAGMSIPGEVQDDVTELSLQEVNLNAIGATGEPSRYALGPYTPFSLYPFALRDIAVWTPSGTEESEVAVFIQKSAGPLLVRMDLFDRFEKTDADGSSRISFAYRLIFQADDRTLSDADIDPQMVQVTDSLNNTEGFQVR